MKQLVRILVVLLLGLALVCGTFALGFGSGYALSRSTWASQSPVVAVTEIATHSPTQPTLPPCATPNCGDGPAWFGVYWEAWDLIENHFYGDLPGSSEVTYAAIRGVLSALGDDYTALIEPQVAAIVEEDATGEFEGIGAYVNVDANGQFVITQPFRSGPAEEAGLVSGDAVLAVDGVSTVGMSLYDVINLIRGPAGSTVTLLIQRPDEPEAFEVVVTRRRIEIPIVEAELRDDGIAYLRLNEFSATATRLVERSLSDLIEDEPVALVLDLRQNPGGWLDQAIGVADIFLDEGVAAREQTSDGVDHVFETETGDVGEYIPMVVLVDRGSASASEMRSPVQASSPMSVTYVWGRNPRAERSRPAAASREANSRVV